MLKVYGFPRSRSTRVVWMLEELGVDYAYVKVDLGAGEGLAPEFRALNPAGKVPVLCDGSFCLKESAAILTYLGDRFPAAKLVPPPGSLDYALYLQWAFFVLTELEQPLWTLAKHKFALPAEHRVPAIADTAIWEFARAAGTLARGINDHGCLIGDRFTAADLLAAHTLSWAMAFKIPLKPPELETYAQRHLARPAYLRAKARDTTS
jgi:glutathione S-transferase